MFQQLEQQINLNLEKINSNTLLNLISFSLINGHNMTLNDTIINKIFGENININKLFLYIEMFCLHPKGRQLFNDFINDDLESFNSSLSNITTKFKKLCKSQKMNKNMDSMRNSVDNLLDSIKYVETILIPNIMKLLNELNKDIALVLMYIIECIDLIERYNEFREKYPLLQILIDKFIQKLIIIRNDIQQEKNSEDIIEKLNSLIKSNLRAIDNYINSNQILLRKIREENNDYISFNDLNYEDYKTLLFILSFKDHRFNENNTDNRYKCSILSCPSELEFIFSNNITSQQEFRTYIDSLNVDNDTILERSLDTVEEQINSTLRDLKLKKDKFKNSYNIDNLKESIFSYVNNPEYEYNFNIYLKDLQSQIKMIYNISYPQARTVWKNLKAIFSEYNEKKLKIKKLTNFNIHSFFSDNIVPFLFSEMTVFKHFCDTLFNSAYLLGPLVDITNRGFRITNNINYSLLPILFFFKHISKLVVNDDKTKKKFLNEKVKFSINNGDIIIKEKIIQYFNNLELDKFKIWLSIITAETNPDSFSILFDQDAQGNRIPATSTCFNKLHLPKLKKSNDIVEKNKNISDYNNTIIDKLELLYKNEFSRM